MRWIESSYQGSGTYNEAEGKEWAALDNVGCHVSAMVALTHHSLIPRNLTAEGVLTAYEEEEHGKWTADVVGGACEGRRDLLEQVDLSFEQVSVGNSSCRPGRDESVCRFRHGLLQRNAREDAFQRTVRPATPYSLSK